MDFTSPPLQSGTWELGQPSVRLPQSLGESQTAPRWWVSRPVVPSLGTASGKMGFGFRPELE